MKPGKLSDLMLLKLNSDTVKKYKETHKVEAKFTHGQISNLITVDLEEMMNPEDDDNADGEFVEDLEDEEEEGEEEGETVTIEDVEDAI